MKISDFKFKIEYYEENKPEVWLCSAYLKCEFPYDKVYLAIRNARPHGHGRTPRSALNQCLEDLEQFILDQMGQV